MGLLDVFNKKEEDKMDALVREIKNNYGSVEPYDKLISYIESKKYVTDFAIITEDDLISVFKVIMHLIKDNELLIEHAIILYNNILYSSSKNDIDLFIKTLNECKNRKFAGIINSISNLFSDKIICIMEFSDNRYRLCCIQDHIYQELPIRRQHHNIWLKIFEGLPQRVPQLMLQMKEMV